VWRSKPHLQGLILAVIGASIMLAPMTSASCELVVTEHRSGREVLRWPINEQPPTFTVSFIHSVLNTPVVDRYELRFVQGQWKSFLVEEAFEGQGYGLPYGETSPGERYERTTQGWRLVMNRLVDPLVQLPLASQNVALSMQDRSVRLADLSRHSMRIEAQGCPSDKSR
jgi:hypothetical protein